MFIAIDLIKQFIIAMGSSNMMITTFIFLLCGEQFFALLPLDCPSRIEYYFYNSLNVYSNDRFWLSSSHKSVRDAEGEP